MSKVVKWLSMVAFCLAAAAFAVTMPDFLGNYTAQPKKNTQSTLPSKSLRVVQTESAIEVTFTRLPDGKPLTGRFPLDGSEADYTTETGASGKCKAELKNDTLVLESFVVSRPDASGRSVRFHTIAQWRLSDDKKTLTVKTEIKVPDMPPEVSAAAFPNNPSTEIYERSDGP